jgi:hypothetical protein
MQLTKAQRRNLELYAIYRSAPPTFWQLFRHNLLRYVVILLLLMLLFVLAPVAGSETFPLMATGFFLGALARDLGRFWQFVRIWPALAIVLDWQQLDALLSDPTAALPDKRDG